MSHVNGAVLLDAELTDAGIGTQTFHTKELLTVLDSSDTTAERVPKRCGAKHCLRTFQGCRCSLRAAGGHGGPRKVGSSDEEGELVDAEGLSKLRHHGEVQKRLPGMPPRQVHVAVEEMRHVAVGAGLHEQGLVVWHQRQ